MSDEHTSIEHHGPKAVIGTGPNERSAHEQALNEVRAHTWLAYSIQVAPFFDEAGDIQHWSWQAHRLDHFTVELTVVKR